MAIVTDPQAWATFLMITVLELVLGLDNIIFLAILVDRLPPAQRARARLLGLGFAMLTRIGLLFSITWLTSLRQPWFTALGFPVTGRALILFGGGVFLIVQSIVEIREVFEARERQPKPGMLNGFWLIIVQIGIIDIAFSLDTVFTAVGLTNRVSVMVVAIVASVLLMMVVASAIGGFIERHPTIKMLALAFLVLIGIALIAESLDLPIPQGYLYVAMAFATAVEALNLRLRRRATQ